MKSEFDVSDVDAAQALSCLSVRHVMGALVMGMMFGMVLIPGTALAAPGQEQGMDMPMDHSEHQHAGHTGHEHHQAGQPGVFSSSVNTYKVPDVKMVDMNGNDVVLKEVLAGNSPIFLNFIFTTCTTICPAMSATFQEVQALLGPGRGDVRMISISIDPEHDTPSTLKEYAKKYAVGPQWTMLTGTLDNSLDVQKAFGIYAGDKMNHKPVTYLKAQGSENSWLRLDGLIDAPDIIKEFDKLQLM